MRIELGRSRREGKRIELGRLVREMGKRGRVTVSDAERRQGENVELCLWGRDCPSCNS